MSLDPQEMQNAEKFFELINSVWISHALCTAAELRIPDILRQTPLDCTAVAHECQCDVNAMRRLLRALVTLGICDYADEDKFSLTGMGMMLAADAPQSMRSWTLMFGRQLSPAWSDLIESVRTGKTLQARNGGTSSFSHLQRDPEAAQLFNQAMVDITAVIAPVAVTKSDLKDARRIVDVGGGNGELLAAFLQAWPATTGICFDLEHAEAGAKRLFSAQGLSHRARHVTGDFFNAIPTADTLLLKNILHDWDDPESSRILAACSLALEPGGRLLIIERLLPARMRDCNRDRSIARADLTMLVGTGGHERTEMEYRTILGEHRLILAATHSLPLDYSLMVCAHQSASEAPGR